MTTFVNYYNLCSIADPKEFLGISEGRDSSMLITTLSKNVVIIIKVNTQKQLYSWSVVEKLSTRVVYDRESQQYVGMFSGRFLRFWDENTTDINKCKKLKFYKSLMDLITFNGKTYVLYADGGCEVLQQALQARKDETKKSSDSHVVMDAANTLSNAKITKIPGNGRLILTYFDRNHSNGEFHLVCRYLINSDTYADQDALIRRFRIQRECLNVTIAGYAIIEGSQYPMLLTIWSDKRLFLLTITDAISSVDSPGSYVAMITDLKVDSPLSIMGITQNFIAIYGANSGQEGASLILYNTQFKVVKAKQFFKVYFDYSNLWHIGSEHIILAMGQNLTVVSYHMSKELLADLVGTQVHNDTQMVSVDVEHINEEEQLQDSVQFTHNRKQNYNDLTNYINGGDYEITEACLSNDKAIAFENINDFDKTFNELNRLQLDLDYVIDDDVKKQDVVDDIKVVVMRNREVSRPRTAEVQTIVQQLERSGASEHEIAEKIVPLLIKADLLTDITICLQRYTNITEKILVKALKYLLQRIQSKSPSPCNIYSIAEEVTALKALLCCNVDVSTLGIYMGSEIEHDQVVQLLEILYTLLTNSVNSSSTNIVPSPLYTAISANADLELHIFDWFKASFNAHFQKFALSKDQQLIELLYKWHQLIDTYKHEMSELEHTLAVLYNLVERRKIIKEKSYSKWYSIEEVNLF